MNASEPQLFCLKAARPFADRIASALDIPLSEHEERDFEDGEHKSRPLESVRGRNVFVIVSLYQDAESSVNDKLVRLLFFLGALRDAGACTVTAVIPYLCYARKDRKTKLRDPVTTRYVAQLFEAVRIDRLITVDVHNLAAFQNAYRCPTEHLEARSLFVSHLAHTMAGEQMAIVSPDAGGLKRAEAFREALEERLGVNVTSGFMEKRRSRGVVTGELFVGDVRDRVVVIVDDLISTGTTILRAASAAVKNGARSVVAVATHGLFVDAEENMRSGNIRRVLVTDTIPPSRLPEDLRAEKLQVVSSASLFADAIHRINYGH